MLRGKRVRELFSFLKYLKKYKIESILAPLFKLLEASFELFVPIVIADMIDNGISRGDKAYILSRGGILFILAVVGVISAITAQYFSAKLAAGFGTDLRNDIFAKILSLPHSQIDIVGADTLITRMTSDSYQFQTGVNLFFRLVLRSPFIVFGAMYMAMRIDIKAGYIFGITILILGCIASIISRKTVKLYQEVQKKLEMILGRSLENLTGIRVIRAFARQEIEKEKFSKNIQELYQEQIRAGNISILMNPLTYMVVNMGMIALLYTGAIDVSIGNLSQGDVVAFINYMMQILVEILKSIRLVELIVKSIACANRIYEIFTLENTLVDGKIDIQTAYQRYEEKEEFLRFSNVSFSYPLARSNAVENINFSVQKGETIGIIGGTGSGKSTLIHLIPRFYDIKEGEISFLGHNIKEYSLDSLRSMIAVAEQKSRLFGGNIIKNLYWGKENASIEELKQAMEYAQAKDILEKKQDEGGFYAEVSQMGVNFSGGQRQRLALARAFVRKSPILILDDVSSALDFLTDAKLRKVLQEEFKDTTIFIVSQRVSSIRYADQILVMDAGHIVGQGKHKELIKNCVVYREICQSQLSDKEIS